ncbi:MAG: hypothetical protein ABIC57_01395 [bacterium]
MHTLYTVSRVRSTIHCPNHGAGPEDLKGPLHGADVDYKTVCGQGVDMDWYIVNNAFDGEITCKKCLKTLEKLPTISQRTIARGE